MVFTLAASLAADPIINAPISEPAQPGDAVDLLKQYPTTLTAGDTDPSHARPWQFHSSDIFKLSQFNFAVGDDLSVKTGPADLGIGHCADGAVFTIVIPRDKGELTFKEGGGIENISHVWLRFHPKEIGRLFPPETVTSDGRTNLFWQMRLIASAKFNSSWHAGANAMIPRPNDVTVDIDTQDEVRRFFMVDSEAHTATYVHAFENRAVKLPPEFSPDVGADAFDKLWNAFDQSYAGFALRPEVNWSALRDHYRPMALASKSTYEFAAVCAEMLKPLRDLHVWLTVAGESFPVFNRERASNANPEGTREIIMGAAQDSGGMSLPLWAVTTNNIGYIWIEGWSDPELVSRFDEALEQMRNTRALILDVRLNGGGSEPIAKEVAGRFLDKEFVYAYDRQRNGPGHTNLTERYPRKVARRGPWRYNRPVLLLIGQKCMSSNESFISMMTGDPDVTTFGDHTCGSSGNPQIVDLPLDMTVSVPQWIDYRPDGVSLDEQGFQPKVAFNPGPGAFDGSRDDLLADALARVAQFKLPETPIAGPSIDDENPETASLPKVVSVTPTDGATGITAETQLRIKFDQPMDPLSLKLNWKNAGFLNCGFSEYDSNRCEFTIPVHLIPGALHRVVINEPDLSFGSASESRKQQPRDGFQSEDHKLARSYSWSFQTEAPQTPQQPVPVTKSISPSLGTVVPCRTFVKIQFDQPMAAPDAAPLWISSSAVPPKQPQMFDPTYNPANHTFRIPFIFHSNDVAELNIHGFQSALGVPARPVNIRYNVSSAELSDEDQHAIATQIQDPRLQFLLREMKAQRLQLTSVAERVQDMMLQRAQHAGQFVALDSTESAFKWQQPNQFFGDATAPMMMCTDFRIGCNGKQWWWHVQSSVDTNVVFQVCPSAEISVLNVSICDPFDLLDEAPANAAKDSELNYPAASAQKDSGIYVIQGWDINRSLPGMPYSRQLEWRIDSKNKNVIDMRQSGTGFALRRRFIYDALNTSLSESDFATPKFKGITPTAPEPLGSGYTNRFINLRDGQDGDMGARFGKTGPAGRYSSGLN